MVSSTFVEIKVVAVSTAALQPTDGLTEVEARDAVPVMLPCHFCVNVLANDEWIAMTRLELWGPTRTGAGEVTALSGVT